MSEDKETLIQKLHELNIEFNPNASVAVLKKLLDNAGSKQDQTDPDPTVLNMLKSITSTLQAIDNRLSKVEGKSSNEYRTEAKKEDIKKASDSKQNVDPRIVKIVEETLGVDFGVEVTAFDDRPGFLFTVVVPQRLSDNVVDSRPIKDPTTGLYVKDEAGNTKFEPFFAEDRRSRAIGSTQSYEAIQDHCNRIRNYIVSFYQKMKQPLPEFKVR